jgi:hypothetical protein
MRSFCKFIIHMRSWQVLQTRHQQLRRDGTWHLGHWE